ncbi:hypothetical protein PFNF54_00584 [Plasmodium falciparum NF54]|uniref:Uncharacterized protein n=1 Tax=Plasmodium falciparum (isolate NF54) TaxID=5843 RepID=W7KCH6_PLAFO|nr:hypothetical protein PFNF54_00584 [Plasmodium falciparum NF54]
MLNDLKMLCERSYNEILQLKKEKENILSDKNLVLEAKKKELDKKVDGVELEIMNNSYMINDVLKKVREIFKKTHVQYEYEEGIIKKNINIYKKICIYIYFNFGKRIFKNI